MATRDRRNQVKVGALTFALIIDALQTDGCSVKDLVEVTGCAPCTIRTYVNALKAKRCIFIVDYTASQGRAKIYALGRREDAKRPTKFCPRYAYHERKRRAAAALLDQHTRAQLTA